MADGHIECPELEGKTVRNLRIYNNSGDSQEVLIEFTDGTSFAAALRSQREFSTSNSGHSASMSSDVRTKV